MMANAPREQWNSRAGFILAAIGSAVGLGNMWRFSYLTAEKGGAAFVLLYLVFTLVVGLPVMLAELVVGRGARKSPIQALAHFGGPSWKILGAVFVAAGFLILSYYAVIAGWTVRYAGEAIFTGFVADSGAHFGAISEGWDAFFFHLIVMAATVGVVLGGVKGGIEKVAMIAMPALFLLVVGISIYAAGLPGSGAGYDYYLNADYSKALSVDVLVAAAGQAFFSLSLGMGAMLTFASYLSRASDLPGESLVIAGSDFCVAFVAGLMVFPLIFALGLSGDVSESTLGALFVVMPKAFASMGLAGRVVGALFFLTLVVGALTSAISLLEVVVAACMDGLGWPRRQAALCMGTLIAGLGALSAWNIGVLDVMDQVATNLFLLGGGLGMAVFVGWVMKDPEGEARVGAEGVTWFFLWRMLLRFAVPAVLLFVLWHSVPGTFKAIGGLWLGS
jgi:NSS family neurotransmitter:Na+ symporter